MKNNGIRWNIKIKRLEENCNRNENVNFRLILKDFERWGIALAVKNSTWSRGYLAISYKMKSRYRLDGDGYWVCGGIFALTDSRVILLVACSILRLTFLVLAEVEAMLSFFPLYSFPAASRELRVGCSSSNPCAVQKGLERMRGIGTLSEYSCPNVCLLKKY